MGPWPFVAARVPARPPCGKMRYAAVKCLSIATYFTYFTYFIRVCSGCPGGVYRSGGRQVGKAAARRGPPGLAQADKGLAGWLTRTTRRPPSSASAAAERARASPPARSPSYPPAKQHNTHALLSAGLSWAC
jgi:hypothetical protein